MTPCETCKRHLRAGETICPFCGEKVRSTPSRVLRTLVSGASMVVLAACYGPSVDKFETGACLDDTGLCDSDGDGWSESQGDCDDANAAVNPDAAETCDDGVDNDCDTLIDLDDSEDCVVGT